MKKAKLEELIADLGYALMYLKEGMAHLSTDSAVRGRCQRTRELVSKVGDALVAELNKPAAKPNGRTWTDTRRIEVRKLAQQCDLFRDARLTATQIDKLYEITIDEHENWDGEDVEPKHILSCMVARYTTVGLVPSRN